MLMHYMSSLLSTELVNNLRIFWKGEGTTWVVNIDSASVPSIQWLTRIKTTDETKQNCGGPWCSHPHCCHSAGGVQCHWLVLNPNSQHCVYCLTMKGSCHYFYTQITLQKTNELPASGRPSKIKIQKLTAVRKHNTLHVKRIYAVWQACKLISVPVRIWKCLMLSHSYISVVFQM